MSKIIPYSSLVRQQHLNFLTHQGKEYREREDYLARARKLLFKIEAQMRQAEIQQLELFREIADHFKLPLKFPDLGDRIGLQQFFQTHPLIQTLQEFFAARLTPQECWQRIKVFQGDLPESPSE